MRRHRLWLAMLAFASMLLASCSTGGSDIAAAAMRMPDAATRWEVATPAATGASAFCGPEEKSRFADCAGRTFTFDIRQGQSAQPLGTVLVDLKVAEVVPTNARKWTAHYTARFHGLTGSALTGTTATVLPQCHGACEAPATAGPTDAPVHENGVLQGEVTFTSATPAIATSSQSIDVRLFNPAAAGSGSTEDPSVTLGPVRCDNAQVGQGNGGPAYQPGCVMKNVVPTFRINAEGCKTLCPQHAAFVQRAQADPKTQGFGRPGSGRPLTRQVLSAAAQQTKRNQVCPGSWPRNPSPAGTPRTQVDSCDEYPYSSTYQGLPQYAVTGHVPLADNTAGGNQLQVFYGRNHILDGDPFYVQP